MFVCVSTDTDFSAEDKPTAASNFARWFVGVLGRESPILGNFAPPEAQNGEYAGVQFVQGLDHTRGPCACRFVQRAGHA